MTLTPGFKIRPVIGGLVMAAVVGLTSTVNHTDPAPTPIAGMEDTYTLQQSLPAGDWAAVIPAVDWTPAVAPQAANPDSYQPVLYRKGWFGRNAPVLGGAGGGALVGGLLGGGKGALIGGAVGGGGGYLYKRSRHHHH